MSDKKTLMPFSMNSGGLMGFSLIVASLLTYIMGLPMDHWLNNVLTYGILIGGLFVFIKKYRDENLGGYISLGQVVGVGTMISAFTAVLYDFYFWIYLMFINTGAVDLIKEKAYEQYIANGMSEEQAIGMLEQAAPFMTPGFFVIMGFFGTVVMGLIFSLIIGLFLKRKQPKSF